MEISYYYYNYYYYYFKCIPTGRERRWSAFQKLHLFLQIPKSDVAQKQAISILSRKEVDLLVIDQRPPRPSPYLPQKTEHQPTAAWHVYSNSSSLGTAQPLYPNARYAALLFHPQGQSFLFHLHRLCPWWNLMEESRGAGRGVAQGEFAPNRSKNMFIIFCSGKFTLNRESLHRRNASKTLEKLILKK